MKIINKFHIALSALAIMTVASFAGAISGTVAWFAYSTRAKLSYVGTSVDQGVLLQVGLVCDQKYWSEEDADDLYKLTYENVDGKHIYFSKGGLNSTIMGAYLTRAGYAVNTLEPLTSAEYTTNLSNAAEDVVLYKAPTAFKARSNHLNGTAQPRSYSFIKLAFRVMNNDDTINKNQPVWLTHSVAEARTSADGNISQAIRVFIDGTESGGQKFIYNPSAENDGYVNVAGLLNLNKDDYYDVYGGEELIYGDYTGSLATTHNAADSASNVDMNGTGVSTKATTFCAKHKRNSNIYDYSSTDFLAGIAPKRAEYVCLDSIKPNEDFTGGLPVCTTSNDDDGVGYVNLKIWLEGWDHTVINEEINHQFNLGLQFEVAL